MFAGIMSLYITHQQVSQNQATKLQFDQRVMSSRISAFKNLQQNKAFYEIGNTSIVYQTVNPYFTQPETYNLNHANSLFYECCKQLYPNYCKLIEHFNL